MFGQVWVVLPLPVLEPLLPELELPLLELPLEGVLAGVALDPELRVVVAVVGEAATARVMANPPANPPTISPPVTVAMASLRRHR